MDSEVVKELVQYDLTLNKLLMEFKAIIKGGEKRERILSDYQSLREKLGPSGASSRIALEMVKSLRKDDIRS